ncbi:MAG: hypothetical protein KDE55_06895, partial [Novosphingobium sp.]|nr:hypothetical protein [Novosphingobium sp.]
MTKPDLTTCPDAAALKSLAVERAGLDDFGDPGRDAGLDALLASMARDTWNGMTGAARELAVDYLVHQLV